MALQTRAISWIGFCKRVSHTKEDGVETKVLEIPFKCEGNKTKYVLRITKTKENKNSDFLYEIFEVTTEYNGMIETFKQETHLNHTTVLIDLICQHKKAKRELRWLKGWLQ